MASTTRSNLILLPPHHIIEHQAIKQLELEPVLEPVRLQLVELERFQPLGLEHMLVPVLVQQRRIRLDHSPCCCRMNCSCRSLKLGRNMADMSCSWLLERCMCCSSDSEHHNGCSDGVKHNDGAFGILPDDRSGVGQLQRCWRAALQPTQTGFQDVASFFPL